MIYLSDKNKSLFNNELNEFLKTITVLGEKNDVYIEFVSKDAFHKNVNITDSEVVAFCQQNKITIINLEDCSMSKLKYLNILKHEIVHAVIYNNCKCNVQWINEGCAVYFSKQYDLRKEVTEKIKSIKELEKNFIGDKSDYIISGIYIKYIFECCNGLFLPLISGKIDIYDIESDAIKYVQHID